MIETWEQAYEAWDEYIDDYHQNVKLFGIGYQPSMVLREVDPTHYRTAFNDWADGMGIDTDELTGHPERH